MKLDDILQTSSDQHANSYPDTPVKSKTYLIVGASRGIGLELVRQLLLQQHQVIAVVRSIESASSLWQLTNATARPNQCVIEQCDVADSTQIDAFMDRMRYSVERGGSIDTIVLNAGILQYDKGLGSLQVEFADLVHHLTVNCVGNVVLARKLLNLNNLPFIKQERKRMEPVQSRSNDRRAERGEGIQERVKRIKVGEDMPNNNSGLASRIIGSQVVFMSSDSGSMADFREYEDGFAAYGASKAALNMMIRHMAVELRRRSEKQTAENVKLEEKLDTKSQQGVTATAAAPTSTWEDEVCVLAMHPGEVATDMANINADLDWEVEGVISAEESVRCMLKVLEDKGPSQTGTFWRWDGDQHPW